MKTPSDVGQDLYGQGEYKALGMRHIVVTRYNVRTHFAGVDANAIRNAPEWLLNRKKLFDTFCLPSMRKQINKNFKWFLLFDEGTDESYTNYFSDVGIPVLCGSNEDGHEKIKDCFKDEGPCFTVTTRLDNDDALSKHYIEVAQLYARAAMYAEEGVGIPHALNFRTGYELDIESKAVNLRDFPDSSFFSLIEGIVPSSEIRFASMQHHARIGKTFPVTNLSTKDPFWMMSLHRENAGNEAKGKATDASGSDISNLFGVDIDFDVYK